MAIRSERADELFLTDQESDPTEIGATRLVDGIFRHRDKDGVYDPRQGGAGMTPADHRVLPQLIHYLDEGPGLGYVSGATKTLDDSRWPTLVEWKRQDATLLIEKTITRSGGGATKKNPTPVVWKLYDTDGTTVLETVSDAITYDAGGEISRVRTIS